MENPGIISFAGSLGTASRDRVRAALGAALAYAGARRMLEVVVDVHAVRFIDAGTIRLMIGAHQSAADAGRGFRLAGAQDSVRRAIEASGSDGRLLRGASRERVIGISARLSLPESAGNLARASAERLRAEGDQVRIRARIQQQAVDGEVRATRRTLLTDLREQLRTDPRALASDGFLALADPGTVHSAILMAAVIVGGADACELRLDDEAAIVRRRGFTDDELPVICDYPLHDPEGRPLGVLSMFYSGDEPRPGDPDLVAECAELALIFHRPVW